MTHTARIEEPDRPSSPPPPGALVPVPPAPRLPLEELVTRYQEALVIRQASAYTVRGYGRDLDAFVAFMAAWRPGAGAHEVTPRDIRAWLGVCSQRLQPRSLLRRFTALRSCYTFAVPEELVAVNPCLAVEAPRFAQRLPDVPTPDELRQLLEVPGASAEDPLARRDRAMLELLYGAGLRAAELIGLNLADVDLDPHDAAGLVRAFGKGKRDRVVPIFGEAVVKLQAYLATARPELARQGPRFGATADDQRAVFLSYRGRRFPQSNLNDMIRTRAAEAGLRGGCTRTSSAMPSARTCSRRAPTSGRSRSSWGTPSSRRPRSIRGCRGAISSPRRRSIPARGRPGRPGRPRSAPDRRAADDGRPVGRGDTRATAGAGRSRRAAGDTLSSPRLGPRSGARGIAGRARRSAPAPPALA